MINMPLRIVTWFAHEECYWNTAMLGTSDTNRLKFDGLRSLQSRTRASLEAFKIGGEPFRALSPLMAVLTTSLHMSPAIRNQDLHFVDEAGSAGLREMRLRFLPQPQPVVDDPINREPRHPIDRPPATEAVPPQAHVDFRQG